MDRPATVWHPRALLEVYGGEGGTAPSPNGGGTTEAPLAILIQGAMPFRIHNLALV